MQTNLHLLRAIATQPDFAAGNFDTGFIARHAAELLSAPPPPPDIAIAAAAIALLRALPASADPWGATNSWRLNLDGWQSLLLRGPAGDIPVRARWTGESATLSWHGAIHAAAARADGNRLTLHMAGAAHTPTVLQDGARLTIIVAGETYGFEHIDVLAPPEGSIAGAGRVLAPIPGRIAAVLVAEGAAVSRGQALVVMEAMKMELTLTAAADGTVALVRCTVGEMVEEGRELVELASAVAA